MSAIAKRNAANAAKAVDAAEQTIATLTARVEVLEGDLTSLTDLVTELATRHEALEAKHTALTQDLQDQIHRLALVGPRDVGDPIPEDRALIDAFVEGGANRRPPRRTDLG